MRAEFLQKRLISAFFGFQWLNLAEILHLFKKYNNVGKVAVKRVSLTDYALWTLGSLDALVKKSSFPFHRSDYLCRESVDAAITHFFCRECCIYVLFCRECRDYALFDVEFYAEFLEEILRNTQNFGRKSAEKVGRWSLCITQRLVEQNKTSSLLYWKISSKISVGHLESLSSGQVSTSAIGNLAMKVSTFWRILGVTSPVHSLGHWQSISDSLPYLLESWSLKLNKPLCLSHISKIDPYAGIRFLTALCTP